MPRRDGTGPRGAGMFTGRGEGHCVLRLPEPGSGEPAVGYAGIQGTPVELPPEALPESIVALDKGTPPVATPMLSSRLSPAMLYPGRGRRCRFGRRRS
jgi:hypothetical protein